MGEPEERAQRENGPKRLGVEGSKEVSANRERERGGHPACWAGDFVTLGPTASTLPQLGVGAKPLGIWGEPRGGCDQCCGDEEYEGGFGSSSCTLLGRAAVQEWTEWVTVLCVL